MTMIWPVSVTEDDDDAEPLQLLVGTVTRPTETKT